MPEPQPEALQSFDDGAGFLKAGFLGFPKSGKTYTAALLAIRCREHFKLDGPIAMLDTEGGGVYIAPVVKAATGASLIGKRSRVFDDLMATAAACERGAASVLIVDSITHIWREVCDAYLVEVNAARASQGKSVRTRLEFLDWATIKAKWGEWTSFYLNSDLHIIICGRAGYDWDFEERENADGSVRKELIKTGVKMKVESEFGFEPSLLIDMRRVSVFNKAASQQEKFIHRAVVLGDRFQILDGASCDNPTGNFFQPHLDLLTPGAHNKVDTKAKTKMGVDAQGDRAWQRERRQRTILCEEIQGLMQTQWPSQKAADKTARLDAMETCFQTRSWKKIEGMKAERLRAGLTGLRVRINKLKEAQADG